MVRKDEITQKLLIFQGNSYSYIESYYCERLQTRLYYNPYTANWTRTCISVNAALRCSTHNELHFTIAGLPLDLKNEICSNVWGRWRPNSTVSVAVVDVITFVSHFNFITKSVVTLTPGFRITSSCLLEL